jgi:hypothetical protein
MIQQMTLIIITIITTMAITLDQMINYQVLTQASIQISPTIPVEFGAETKLSLRLKLVIMAIHRSLISILGVKAVNQSKEHVTRSRIPFGIRIVLNVLSLRIPYVRRTILQILTILVTTPVVTLETLALEMVTPT